MGWVDSHCHLNFKALDAHALVPDLLAHNFEAILVPATQVELFPDVIALKNQYPHLVRVALGLHPFFLAEHDASHLEQLEKYVIQYKPHAIGECGLDFMLSPDSVERQYFYFTAQVEIAKQYSLPLVIHCRKAHDQIISEVKRAKFQHGGFIHGFSGSLQQAKRYIEQGFVLGLGGALTYERAKAMHKMVAALPDDGFTLETDSPDMPPAFARNEVNTPLNVPRIAHYIANLRGQSIDHIQDVSRQNFYSIVGKPAG
ncbi:metal-dependent hydrolase [Oceaniserpentilla sp. 4NH20-0058]|uniref:TatD family hydrolase n=1 Tax=Oceaniserpentilla sp. 4NH20-0058 TaxID=3127660 RepID=UPI00310851AD